MVPREPVKPVVYPNKEAAKEAFKQLLQVSTRNNTNSAGKSVLMMFGAVSCWGWG